jgi:hypothetical protein
MRQGGLILGTTIKVRVKPFKRLPRGIDPSQRKYFGRIITVTKKPIIIGYTYEQVDPLQEARFGKWVWSADHIIALKGQSL